MRKKRAPFSLAALKKAERMIVGTMVLFAALAILASSLVGVDKVTASFGRITPSMLALMLTLSLVNFTTRGIRWEVFGRRMKLNVPLKRMALYYFAGMSLIATPGKVGTALRLWFLNKCHNISYSRGLPLMIMDPVCDVLALFLLTLLGAENYLGHYGTALFGFGLLAFGGVLILSNQKLGRQTINMLYRLFGKKNPRLFIQLRKLAATLARLTSPTAISVSTLSTAIGWAAEAYAFYLILQAMGAPLPLTAALFIFSFATLIGGMTMMPGGLGSTEATMVGLLTLSNIPLDIAVAATTVIRLGTLWFSILIGFAVLPFGLRLAKKAEV